MIGSGQGEFPSAPHQTVTASHGSTVYVAGRDVTITHPPAPVPGMEAVREPARLLRVPDVPGSFVGRQAELARLDAAVTSSGGRGRIVLHGLGGSGKSTVAARFAELHAGRFAPRWWINADSPAAVEAGLARLAVALAPETAGLRLEQLVELAVHWLGSHDGWLLVLDNLTHLADASVLLDRVKNGTVLITSRTSGGWGGATTVAVGVLPRAKALRLLTRVVREHWPKPDLTDGKQLCAELGWLPLAIRQAGAYLGQTRTVPTAYLKLLAEFPARMFTATAENDTERTIARVWHVTLNRLTNTPLAGHLLRRLAWCAPDDIPRWLFTPGGEGGVPDPDVIDAFGRLAAYSMITLDAEAVRVHRLVQAVSRTPDDDPHRRAEDIADARDATTINLAGALHGHNPIDPATWPRFRTLLPHARALVDHATPESDTPATCQLINSVSQYLLDQGDPTTTIAYLTRATASLARLRGHTHHDTLMSRNNLARCHETAGDLKRAIELYEQVIADIERVSGPDHPAALTPRNNLAGAYLATGDFGRAIPLMEKTLADRERVLGPDHPETLTTRNNLAYAHQAAGDPRRAIPLLRSALADRERVLGSNHPETLTTRNNLAYAHQMAGELRHAIPQFEATVTATEQVLGNDHPDTLRNRNNLALAYQAAGDLDRALPLLRQNLADSERVLGSDHPTTINSRNSLGRACVAVDPGQAFTLVKTALADSERVLGPDHPNTLTIRGNLAGMLVSSGRPDLAVTVLSAVLKQHERVLGPDHPDTVTLRSNLDGLTRK
uniref:FxSxx-COOH system tetratricopeptide repeat protein n=1 Tax=Saccharothrix mutabilis TaxID=33921 RepID=UPI0031DC10D1